MALLISTSFKITYDEAQRCLIVNGRKLGLEPKERALTLALVLQYAAREADEADDRLVSLDALCQVAGVALPQLKVVVCKARSWLQAHELDIKSVRSEGYYLKLPKGATLIYEVIPAGTHPR
jgi:DNA-binding response OmpR family regulator